MIAHCLTRDKETWLLILAKLLLSRLLVNHSLSVYPLVSMGSRKDRIQMKPQLLAGRLERANLSVAFQLRLLNEEMRQHLTHISLPGSKVTSRCQRDPQAWRLWLQAAAFAGSRRSQPLDRKEQLKAHLGVGLGQHFAHSASLVFPSLVEHASCRSGHSLLDFAADLLSPAGLHLSHVTFVPQTRHAWIYNFL